MTYDILFSFVLSFFSDLLVLTMSSTGMFHDRTARYFDLVHHPESLKNMDGTPISDSELKEFVPANGTPVPAHWNVDFGDVLNWSKGRPTEAFFIMEDRSLLKNPDRSGSGYLTIPLIVTSDSFLFLDNRASWNDDACF